MNQVREIRLVGIDEDREIEEVRGEDDRSARFRQLAGLQNVEALDDQDVGPVNDGLLARR